jgi:hypothetical protein
MALLQNGYRDFSSGVRIFGATASNNAYPSALHANRAFTSTMRNLTAGEGISSELVSLPSGYRARYAWMMAQKPGALASRSEIEGAGDLFGSIAGGKNAEASLSGAGDMVGVGQLIISMAATLSGSGDITGAELKAFLNLAASLTGDGAVAGLLTAQGALAAELAGSGDIDAVITALGTLAASITVTGDLLTTANVGNAVLDALNGVEDEVTLRQALRIILSALGGKVSISGNTVTFRDANDTKDRITATTDSNGQRTAVTLDAD